MYMQIFSVSLPTVNLLMLSLSQILLARGSTAKLNDRDLKDLLAYKIVFVLLIDIGILIMDQ